MIGNPGVRCGKADTHWADQPQLAGLKLLARTEQVLAARQAAMAGWDDAIMLAVRGQVISSSRGNIFVVTGGQVDPDRLDAALLVLVGNYSSISFSPV